MPAPLLPLVGDKGAGEEEEAEEEGAEVVADILSTPSRFACGYDGPLSVPTQKKNVCNFQQHAAPTHFLVTNSVTGYTKK